MGGEEGERARIKASKLTDTVTLDCGAFNNRGADRGGGGDDDDDGIDERSIRRGWKG